MNKVFLADLNKTLIRSVNQREIKKAILNASNLFFKQAALVEKQLKFNISSKMKKQLDQLLKEL